MSENSKVDERIAAILLGSGLPIERRTEVTEELRDHLGQCVEARCRSGMPEDEAIEVSLAAFGSPKVIRKQLRRQQRMLDRQDAWTEIRRIRWAPWVLVIAAGIHPVAITILHPQPPALLMRCLWALFLFAASLITIAFPMYWGALYECRIKHRRPREEYCFFKSFLRGMGVGGVFLGWICTMLPLVLVLPITPLLFEAPEFVGYLPSAFLYNFGVAVPESAGRTFGLFLLGVLGFGVTVAFYERSRCVVKPAALAGE